MNAGGDENITYEDDNAVDEFYAQRYYKLNPPIVRNTSTLIESNFSENQNILTRKVFNDCTNLNVAPIVSNDKIVSLKRKFEGQNEIEDNKRANIELSDNDCAYFLAYNTSHYELSTKNDPDSLSSLNESYSESRFVTSLSVPQMHSSRQYSNALVVAVPWSCERLLKSDQASVLGTRMFETANIEMRTLSVPCRKSCSPREQYSLTEGLQYMSDSLLRAHQHDNIDHVLAKRHRRHGHIIDDSADIAHFHDMYLERLACNQLADFMSVHGELSGSILSGYVNDVFELSRDVYLPGEVVHAAVDLIYQYLSRVPDVPLSDLQLVALGAVWVAGKTEGLQYTRQICRFAACSLDQLKHAELRLLAAVDCNLTKPNAITFRDRFIVLEGPTSTVSMLSSFLLDMCLHCYTVMVLPASRRAAAALWLARLVERFDDLRADADATSAEREARVAAVWPVSFQRLTGYRQTEVARLAVTMHVVVLALLCRGQQRNPSVDACYHKYSHDNYKNLTGCYERFTCPAVLAGVRAFCSLLDIDLAAWLDDRREYEGLTRTTVPLVISGPSGSNSCPPEALCHSRHGNEDDDNDEPPQSLSLRKLDSGYGSLIE